MVDSIWRGGTKKVALFTLVGIFVLSLITYILGIVTAVRIGQEQTRKSSPSHAVAYFYAAAYPVALTIASGIEIVLYFTGFLYPVVSIIWTIVSFGVWIYQLMLWGICEYDAGDICPRFDYFNTHGQQPIWYVRMILGGILAILSLVYLGAASRAVELERKGRKQNWQKGYEDGHRVQSMGREGSNHGH